MIEERIEFLLARLERRLNIVASDDTVYDALHDSICNAAEEMSLYLATDELPNFLDGKLVELAAIDYRSAASMQGAPGGVKSSSYSEGDVSQSVTYSTAQDVQAAKDSVLRSIAHYRRRARC